MFEYKKIVDEMLKQNGFEHQSLSYLEKRYKDTEYFGDDYNESLRLFKFLFAVPTKIYGVRLPKRLLHLSEKWPKRGRIKSPTILSIARIHPLSYGSSAKEYVFID